MQGKVDLHLHTRFSDGDLSPEEIVAEAKKKGYSVISICDHDCVDAIEAASKTGAKCGVRVIPGVEITAEKDGLEVHILGYFIDYKDEKLKDALAEVRESRVRRIHDMIGKLKQFDINISPEEVFKLSPEGSVGRPHLAKALVNGGHIRSEQEAFKKYLADNAPCYVARFNIIPEKAIKLILEAKGVPVYAHPKMMGRDDFIPGFVRAGLRGLEAYHTDHNTSARNTYIKMAEKYNLVITGGSDFHGDIKKDVFIGTVNIPHELVQNLEKEAEKIRNQ